MAAADGSGVEWERDGDWVTFRRGARSGRVQHGRVFPGWTPATDALCADKQATKDRLSALGIPVPASIVLRTKVPAEVRARVAGFVARRAGSFVCKPLDGTEGQGVILDLDRPEAIVAAVLAEPAPAVLVEEHVPGQDLRVQAIGRRVVAACIRRPATVLGDGVRSIRALMAQRDRRVMAQNPQNRLRLDAESMRLLADTGWHPEDVPPEGTAVAVKRVANMSQGGHAIDVTDGLHPGYQRWVTVVAEALGLDVFALDIIVADPTQPPSRARLLEVNAQPQWLHHTFSEGRTHDVPKLLLDWLLGGD